MDIEVIFESEDLLAINKPHGLIVHKTSMAKDAKEFALQKVRKIVGHRVYPVHRLDRKTSGVLLFSKHLDANRKAQQLFREGQVNKIYHAIVRGYLTEAKEIDYPLNNGKTLQKAITHITPLKHFEISIQTDRYPTSRYTLVEAKPTTGRFHQIRKHLAHIRHPIIGDRPHGCNKQNRYWKKEHGIDTMMLHAISISFYWNNQEILISARRSKQFVDFVDYLNYQNVIEPFQA